MVIDPAPGAVTEALRLVEHSSYAKGYLEDLLAGKISWGSEEVDALRRTDKAFEAALNLLTQSNEERHPRS